MNAPTNFIPETFKQNSKTALADKPLRKSLRTAMDMLMNKRKAVLSDETELQGLRRLCEQIRQRSLSRLPEDCLQHIAHVPFFQIVKYFLNLFLVPLGTMRLSNRVRAPNKFRSSRHAWFSPNVLNGQLRYPNVA